MSELLGISTRNYQRLEIGEVEPKLETLSKISNILDVPMSTFFDLYSVNLLSINEFLTRDEIITASELLKTNKNSDLNYVKNIIEKDKLHNGSGGYQIQMRGTEALLCDEFVAMAKTKSNRINVDETLVKGSVVDRWEMAHRLKLKSAMYENYYILPVGFKAFQIYHYNINANPDNPTSDSYLRDITDRCNLENWMKSVISNNIPLFLDI